MFERVRNAGRNPLIARVVGGVLLAGVLAGATGCETAFSNEKQPTKVAVEQPAKTECAPLPRAEVVARAKKIQEGLAKPDVSKDGTEIVRDRARIATRYGLHITKSPETSRRIDSATSAAEVVKAMNQLTTKVYGFQTTATPGQSLEAVKEEARFMQNELGRHPADLVLVTGTSAVRLNDPKIKSTVAADGGAAGALAEGSPVSSHREIKIGPGEIGLLSHELFGHEAENAYLGEHCKNPTENTTIKDTGDFDAINATSSKKFRYGQGNWEGVTVSKYGASNVREDLAETARVVNNPTPEECDAIQKNQLYAQKVAAIGLYYNELQPHLGDYISDAFVNRCNANWTGR